MKKISIVLILLFICVIMCGCEKEKNVLVGDEKINVTNMGHKSCTREGTVENGEASFHYDIYYKNDYITLLQSSEKVSSDSSSVLDEYENAYNTIKNYYVGLDNYNQNIIRDNNSVENVIVINYEKLDINKLIAIEGNESNLYTEKGVKLDTWLDFAKKLGVKCSDVEE